MNIDIEIAPEQKYAQRTAQDTFIGMNANSLFKIDPRISGNKMVQEQKTVYSSKVGLSSVATTGQGHIAVGSEKGEIRLFDRLGLSRAKTQLAGLGEPILGMDTTENGKYVLATCASYLLLIDTEAENTSAFKKSIKPQPKRLQLKPEHVAWMGNNIKFTPAYFNTGTEWKKPL